MKTIAKMLLSFCLWGGLLAVELPADRELLGEDFQMLREALQAALSGLSGQEKVTLEIDEADSKPNSPIDLLHSGRKVLQLAIAKKDQKHRITLDNRPFGLFKDNHFYLSFEFNEKDKDTTLEGQLTSRLKLYLQEFTSVLLYIVEFAAVTNISPKIEAMFDKHKEQYHLRHVRYAAETSAPRTDSDVQDDAGSYTSDYFTYDIGVLKNAVKVDVKAFPLKALVRVDFLINTFDFELTPQNQMQLNDLEAQIDQLFPLYSLDVLNDANTVAHRLSNKVAHCGAVTAHLYSEYPDDDQSSGSGTSPYGNAVYFLKFEEGQAGDNFDTSSNDREDDTGLGSGNNSKQNSINDVVEQRCPFEDISLLFNVINVSSFRYLHVKIPDQQNNYYYENFFAITPEKNLLDRIEEFVMWVKEDFAAAKKRIAYPQSSDSGETEGPEFDMDYPTKALIEDLRTLYNVACTEIRSVSLDGDGGLKKQIFKCVQNKAPVLQLEALVNGHFEKGHRLIFLRPAVSSKASTKGTRTHDVVIIPNAFGPSFKQRFFDMLDLHLKPLLL